MTKPPSPRKNRVVKNSLTTEQRHTIERAFQDAIVFQDFSFDSFSSVEHTKKCKAAIKSYRAILRQIREGKS